MAILYSLQHCELGHLLLRLLLRGGIPFVPEPEGQWGSTTADAGEAGEGPEEGVIAEEGGREGVQQVGGDPAVRAGATENHGGGRGRISDEAVGRVGPAFRKRISSQGLFPRLAECAYKSFGGYVFKLLHLVSLKWS